MEEEKAWICANMRNGNWYCGGYFVLQTAFNNKKLRELGYPTFTEFYLKVCENEGTAVYGTVCTVVWEVGR